ncbi:hypothetical protein TorRG33x02_279500 [Trema orientale]|uniref:Uncharacterized protein n=1 Tax=Trema orientale TaxID=63057 RepID=A0A2P5CML7_TREOI|nr:hypothetical protein TorRG33x02_279500 [Trema orientale]
MPGKKDAFFLSGGIGAPKSGVGAPPPKKIGAGALSLYLWHPRVAPERQIELVGRQSASNILFSIVKSLHHTFIICLQNKHITRTSKHASLFIHILGLPPK